MRLPAIAGASPFAHLLGRTAKVAKAADDDDKKDAKAAAEEDDEKGDGDDEGDGPDDGEAKKAKRAESDEPEREEEDSERDEERDDAKKSKKAKGKRAEADDDDDDEEGDDGSDGADMRKKGARSARLRERARCAAIFADAAAGKNPALAAHLAFATDLPRTHAVSVLRVGGLAVGTAPRVSLDDRMARVRTPAIGPGDAAESTAPGLAAQIVAAGRKRRGEV